MIHREQFDRCINLHPMPRTSRGMSARDQFLAMLFAQLTYRESLRDIEACLRGNSHLHAMGIRGNITRTNLAYANQHRDWEVYEALAHVLIRKARRLYAGDSNGLNLDEIVYAVDASTIDLCLSMFPWGNFKTTKAAIKLHTQIDLVGSIPVFISLTEGALHDVHFLDQMFFEAGSIYVFDCGYLDLETEKRLTFLTNHFALPALTVTAIYKNRWKIELFFKWIKQNLRIKTFYGTSENAVYSQIWIAISAYLVVACLNKTYNIDESLSRILQILSVNVFQKVPANELLTAYKLEKPDKSDDNQLVFNGF